MVAHRLSWEMHYGPIPEGKCVLHRCDNPPCVNPEHLFLGTRADNNYDRHMKHRTPKGERHYGSFLKEDAVRRMRKMAAEGYGPAAIARVFGIEMRHAWLIIRGKRWKHVKP